MPTVTRNDISSINTRLDVNQSQTKDITVTTSKTLMSVEKTRVIIEEATADNPERSLRIDITIDDGERGTTYPLLNDIIASMDSNFDVETITSIIQQFLDTCHLYGASQAGF